MGFNKIFNWVRFLAIPPSYLFNNRLFIERNARNKKIFNNLGSTYKSNKWSINKSFNLNLGFIKKNFLNYFYIFIFILFLYLFYFNIYSYSYLIKSNVIFYNLYFFIWRVFDYIFFFIVNFFFLLLSLLLVIGDKLVTFFYPNFKSNLYLRSYTKSSFNLDNNLLKSNYKNKVLLTYLYKNNKYLLLENLFKVTNKENLNLLKFYKKLYTTLYYLNKNNISVFKNTNLVKLSNLSLYINYTLYKSNYSRGVYGWELSNIVDKSKFFFWNDFTNSSYNKVLNLNPELFFLNEKTTNLFKKLEYFKWLYKYSILHSRTIFELDKLNLKTYNLGIMNTSFLENKNSIFNFYLNSINSNLYNNYLNFYQNGQVVNNFKSNINLYNLNSFNNWISSYRYLNQSMSWVLLRNRFFNKPNFNSLKLLKESRKLVNTSNNISLGTITTSNSSLLLTNSKFFKNSSSGNLFVKKGTSNLVLNGFSNEFFNILDKNIIFNILNTPNVNNSFLKFNFLNLYLNKRFRYAELEHSNIMKYLILNKVVLSQNSLLNLYYYYI